MPHRDTTSWNTILAAHATSGDDNRALALFHSMPQRNPQSWNAILAMHCSNRDIDAARSLFAAMPCRDAIAWNTMLAAHAQMGGPNRAKKFFDAMPDQTLASWATLLCAYGHTDGAVALFDLAKCTVSPDAVCWVLVLNACSHSGRCFLAGSYLRSMAYDFAVRPTKQHYNCIVDALARGGYVAEAHELVAEMPFVPDSLEWTCLRGD
ncbi:hypothetical protein SELMODRAFT_80903 [Selaginella moellendorffii]|uniref:Pentacotripeptide-repeat region of PRORP domain-containing protein n=2 Tax=Selaginella moellendorffii TaxID=88036 RepID=D8QZX2_SELML|nr:hypothetical protein SELMODRAFT_80903 [Selaginella moellendorffii]